VLSKEITKQGAGWRYPHLARLTKMGLNFTAFTSLSVLRTDLFWKSLKRISLKDMITFKKHHNIRPLAPEYHQNSAALNNIQPCRAQNSFPLFHSHTHKRSISLSAVSHQGN